MIMINIAVIGLGTICEHYIKAFESLGKYNVSAICDLDEKAPSRHYFSAPFYNDYHDLVNLTNVDLVVISTPPKTHFEIASFFLKHHIAVLVEKPGTLNIDDLNKLIELSKQYETSFKVMYHWQFGSEVLEFNKLYDPSKIDEISVEVYDKYSSDGVSILDEKVGLGGAFLDSGVNMLSMIKTWLPFNSIELISYESQRCVKTNLLIYANVQLLIDGIKVNIKVDWRQNKSNKETHLIYEGRKIEVNNLLQTIFDGDSMIKIDEMDRLDTHYYNLFRLYEGKTNYDEEMKIHQVLFDVNAKL